MVCDHWLNRVGWLCVVFGWGISCWAQGPSRGGGPPPALVGIGHVRSETLQARWDVIGRLREVRRAVVAAEQPGRVVEIEVDEGDPVIGQQTVLARIDDIWAKLSLQSAEARLAQAQASVVESQAQLDQAQRNRKYLDELLEAKSAKPKEVEDSHTDEQAALARLDSKRADLMFAQAELSRRQEELIRLTVRAPFDGMVVRKIAEVGQWVDQGDDVAEIISRGKIDVVIDVPEAVVDHVKINSLVEVFIEPLAMEVRGRVIAINPQGSAAARTFPVKVRIEDQDGRLKPGMSVLTKVPMADRVEVLTVPRDAVHRTARGTVVWAAINGRAAPIQVKILFGEGSRYAVEAIPQGDKGGGPSLADQTPVVIEGAERLFPGRPLKIAEP